MARVEEAALEGRAAKVSRMTDYLLLGLDQRQRTAREGMPRALDDSGPEAAACGPGTI